jgi:hypothetical protein
MPRCALCCSSCSTDYPYAFGPVGGHLCAGCVPGLHEAITAWARTRMRELRSAQRRSEAADRCSADLALEAIPRGLRRVAG